MSFACGFFYLRGKSGSLLWVRKKGGYPLKLIKSRRQHNDVEGIKKDVESHSRVVFSIKQNLFKIIIERVNEGGFSLVEVLVLYYSRTGRTETLANFRRRRTHRGERFCFSQAR